MEKGSVPKIFFIILFAFVAMLFWLFWTYISSIVLALLIASAFYPLYLWITKLFRGKEQTASLVITLFILIVLVIPVSGFVGTLSNEAFDFYQRTKNSVSLQKIQESLSGDSLWAVRIRKAAELTNIEFKPESIQQLTTSIGKNIGLYLSRQLSSFASNLLSFLIHFFLMMLIIYYIFKDGEKLKNYIFELLPFPRKQQELIMDKFREMGKAVVLGNGLSGIIQGILEVSVSFSSDWVLLFSGERSSALWPSSQL